MDTQQCTRAPSILRHTCRSQCPRCTRRELQAQAASVRPIDAPAARSPIRTVAPKCVACTLTGARQPGAARTVASAHEPRCLGACVGTRIPKVVCDTIRARRREPVAGAGARRGADGALEGRNRLLCSYDTLSINDFHNEKHVCFQCKSAQKLKIEEEKDPFYPNQE